VFCGLALPAADARSVRQPPHKAESMRLELLISAWVLMGSTVAAQSAKDSLPPIGARVRVMAPRLGPEWQIGMFNQLRLRASCHRILLFTPTGALRIRATLAPSEHPTPGRGPPRRPGAV
jgi:hypothetical protein